MTKEQRDDVLRLRRINRQPWHSPPHVDSERKTFHVSGACFEHKPYIGSDSGRISDFERDILDVVKESSSSVLAWCILPNHYHLLVRSGNILSLLKSIGRFHGLTSYRWNSDEKLRGRKIWFGCIERAIKNESHRQATLNYIHHNPVHHGYVDKWQEWPFSSSKEYLDKLGRTEMERLWKKYPLLDYGKGWDDPHL